MISSPETTAVSVLLTCKKVENHKILVGLASELLKTQWPGWEKEAGLKVRLDGKTE